MEDRKLLNLKNIWNFYIHNILLRNLTALSLDLCSIALFCYDVYLVFTIQIKVINWWILAGCLIFALIFRKFSQKLRVTRVCPQCLENRGISINVSRTGNTRNYHEYIRGDYWYHEQEVEYLSVWFCNYCSYETSKLYWESESWQGELTEEARIKKAAEAHRKAETQARIDAYEQIRCRNRRYY